MLENKGIKLDSLELEISMLSEIVTKVAENFKEVSRGVSVVPCVSFYEKIAAVIEILEDNGQSHNLKRLLLCENFMQIFHEHGLIPNSIEPQRFWK